MPMPFANVCAARVSGFPVYHNLGTVTARYGGTLLICFAYHFFMTHTQKGCGQCGIRLRTNGWMRNCGQDKFYQFCARRSNIGFSTEYLHFTVMASQVAASASCCDWCTNHNTADNFACKSCIKKFLLQDVRETSFYIRPSSLSEIF